MIYEGKCGYCGKDVQVELRSHKLGAHLFCNETHRSSYYMRCNGKKRAERLVKGIMEETGKTLETIKERESRVFTGKLRQRPKMKIFSGIIAVEIPLYDKFLDYCEANKITTRSLAIQEIVADYLKNYGKYEESTTS